MSTEGHQRIVILRVKNEAQLEERVIEALEDSRGVNVASAPRTITLDYAFGRSRTHAVELDQLDELAVLPWSRVKTDADEAEVRMLSVKNVAAALKILDTLRRRPRTLSKRIAAACQEDALAESALETLASDPRDLDVDDADVTPARLAQFFMQLRRVLRLASTRKQAVGVAIHIDV